MQNVPKVCLLEIEIETYSISLSLVKTASDNVYLVALFVLFDLNN